uniref:Ovule protein n=1 Tax=Ascaris lumbricoides TaxID=6252 RepID=A0A0M3HYX4_ASCLU
MGKTMFQSHKRFFAAKLTSQYMAESYLMQRCTRFSACSMDLLVNGFGPFIHDCKVTASSMCRS